MVLEWTNHQCPYVRKHYGGNNMQALQKKWTGQGVVWLSVISSGPGQDGHVSPQQANKLTTERGAAPSAVLFDPTGKVGREYNARTTPHMYVIAGDGALVIWAASTTSPRRGSRILKIAKNFVDAALSEIAQGKPVSVTQLARLWLFGEIHVVKSEPRMRRNVRLIKSTRRSRTMRALHVTATRNASQTIWHFTLASQARLSV